MKRCLLNIIVFFTVFSRLINPAWGAEKKYSLTGQMHAFAPNAGGQQAYGLKLLVDSFEVGAFHNSYLLVGDQPLAGGSLDFRFPFCRSNCWWEFFAQVGGGFSNAGPLIEATWGAVIPLVPLWLKGPAPRYVPALRLDLTTQMIFIQWRGITWSYPLWAGLSIPF